MKSEEEKLETIISILRNSKPVLRNSEQLIDVIVTKAVQTSETETGNDIYNLFFGWVWIGWVRRSMVAASFFIILFFGLQQASIIGKLKSLSSPTVLSAVSGTDFSRAYLAPGRSLLKLFASKGRIGNIADTSKLESFIRSLGSVQDEFSGILTEIEKDPELKRYVIQRLHDNQKNK